MRLVLLLHAFDDGQLGRLRDAAGAGFTLRHVPRRDPAFREALAAAEVVVGSLGEDELAHAAALRWLQLQSAGANRHAERTPPHVRLTCARGVHTIPVAEHALAQLLALNRQLHHAARHQPTRDWNRLRPAARLDELHGRSLALVGYGDIARHLATLLQPFRLALLAFNRTGRAPATDTPVHPIDALDDHLPTLDYLVVSLPGTPATRHLFDAARLARLKPGARLVNVGRGSVLDEHALAECLQRGPLGPDAGRGGGAALDVFEHEPLPADSPLWDLPNVLITPHTAGGSPRFLDRLADLAAENLRRYAAGEPLLHEVDREQGY